MAQHHLTRNDIVDELIERLRLSPTTATSHSSLS